MRHAAPALAAAVLVAALGILPCCGHRPEADTRQTTGEHPDPAERGRQRARGDIAAGKVRIYRYGNPASFDNPRTDPGSGLPVRTLLDCCITTEAREETEAYNEIMRAVAPARPGPPTR